MRARHGGSCGPTRRQACISSSRSTAVTMSRLPSGTLPCRVARRARFSKSTPSALYQPRRGTRRVPPDASTSWTSRSVTDTSASLGIGRLGPSTCARYSRPPRGDLRPPARPAPPGLHQPATTQRGRRDAVVVANGRALRAAVGYPTQEQHLLFGQRLPLRHVHFISRSRCACRGSAAATRPASGVLSRSRDLASRQGTRDDACAAWLASSRRLANSDDLMPCHQEVTEARNLRSLRGATAARRRSVRRYN